MFDRQSLTDSCGLAHATHSEPELGPALGTVNHLRQSRPVPLQEQQQRALVSVGVYLCSKKEKVSVG